MYNTCTRTCTHTHEHAHKEHNMHTAHAHTNIHTHASTHTHSHTHTHTHTSSIIHGLFPLYFQILFLESEWVVIQMEALLEHIFGVVFAPDGFFLRGLSDIKHGMVPLQRIHALFEKHYEVRLVIDILCELMLAKEIEEENSLQIPALLEVKEQEEVWRVYWKQEPIKYSIHAGWRMECVDETDIFSPSFFPRLQVRMRKAKSSQATAWANGLVFMEDRMQVMVYIEGRKTIDIMIRSEAGMERQCYNLRNEVQKQVKNELEECSSGTAYTNKLIRPADIRVCKPMNDMIAYDYEHVLCEKERGQSTISTDGIHCDTIRELLYCNYDPPLIVDGKKLHDAFSKQEFVAIGFKNQGRMIRLYTIVQ